MGGRGGSASQRPKEDARSEFEWWAGTTLPINVDYTGEGRISIVLPDFNAHVVKDKGVYRILRDSDDKVMFSNSHSLKSLWHEVSLYYGGKVDVSVFPGVNAPHARTGTYGWEKDRRKSPAGRFYGLS